VWVLRPAIFKLLKVTEKKEEDKKESSSHESLPANILIQKIDTWQHDLSEIKVFMEHIDGDIQSHAKELESLDIKLRELQESVHRMFEAQRQEIKDSLKRVYEQMETIREHSNSRIDGILLSKQQAR
jgi:hypothetical protein